MSSDKTFDYLVLRARNSASTPAQKTRMCLAMGALTLASSSFDGDDGGGDHHHRKSRCRRVLAASGPS
jgi:hypothetical protein